MESKGFWWDISNMIFSQTLSGLIVCCVIVFVLILFIIMALRVSRFYKGVLHRIDYLQDHMQEDAALRNNFLIRVAKQFKAMMSSQTRNTDFYAVMDKGEPGNVKVLSSLLSYLPSLAVVLGLLGTFLGLTGAIGSVRLGASSEGTELIVESLRGPIDNMSTAFTTSIFGITASIIMTIMEKIMRLGQLKKDTFVQTEYFFDTTFFDYIANAEPELRHAHLNDPAARAISVAADNFERSLVGLSGTVEGIDKNIGAVMDSSISDLRNVIAELRDAYFKETDSIAAVNASMARYMDILSGLGDTVASAQDTQNNSATLLAQLETTYKMLVEEHALFQKALEGQNASAVMTELNQKLERIGSSIEVLAEAKGGKTAE